MCFRLFTVRFTINLKRIRCTFWFPGVLDPKLCKKIDPLVNKTFNLLNSLLDLRIISRIVYQYYFWTQFDHLPHLFFSKKTIIVQCSFYLIAFFDLLNFRWFKSKKIITNMWRKFENPKINFFLDFLPFCCYIKMYEEN